MPKDNRQPPSKAKVRIFFAEVEGGDETIQDGLRSIANALVRAVQPPAIMRAAAPRALAAGSEPSGHEMGEPLDAELVEDEDPVHSETIPAQEPRRTKVRKANTYGFVSDLNLRPADKQSLREYFAFRKPKNQQEEYLVIVFYLKNILCVEKVSENHIYTAFKDVEKRSPPNIAQTGRNIQARKGWVIVSEPKGIEITVNGENHVEHDMGVAEEEAVEN